MWESAAVAVVAAVVAAVAGDIVSPQFPFSVTLLHSQFQC